MIRSLVLIYNFFIDIQPKAFFRFSFDKNGHFFDLFVFIVRKMFHIILIDLEISTLGTSYQILQKSNLKNVLIGESFKIKVHAFHKHRQIKSMAAQNKRIVYVGKVLFSFDAFQSVTLPNLFILEYFKNLNTL